MAPGIARTQ